MLDHIHNNRGDVRYHTTEATTGSYFKIDGSPSAVGADERTSFTLSIDIRKGLTAPQLKNLQKLHTQYQTDKTKSFKQFFEELICAADTMGRPLQLTLINDVHDTAQLTVLKDEDGRFNLRSELSTLKNSYLYSGHEEHIYSLDLPLDSEQAKSILASAFAMLSDDYLSHYLQLGAQLKGNPNTSLTIRSDLDMTISLGELLKFSERASKEITEDYSSEPKDPLTELRKRGALTNPKMMEEFRRLNCTAVSLISIDIIGMGLANKYLGREVVDEFLMKFGEIGKEIFGDQFGFRNGGDEFVFLVPLDKRGQDPDRMLSKFLMRMGEMRSELLGKLPPESQESLQEAQTVYREKWAIDKVLSDFKTKLKSGAYPSALETNLHASERVETFLGQYLEERGANPLYTSLDAKLLDVARKDLASGTLNPSSEILQIYAAGTIIPILRDVNDFLYGIVSTDREIQKHKAMGHAADTKTERFKPSTTGEEVRLATKRSFGRAIRLMADRRVLEDQIQNSDNEVEKMIRDLTALYTDAYDYSFSTKICRRESVTEVSAARFLFCPEPKEYHVLKVDKLGFGIDNKVHGSDRADDLLNNFHQSIEQVVGPHVGFRDAGGAYYLLFEDRPSPADLQILKGQLDNTAIINARPFEARLEQIKRAALKRSEEHLPYTHPYAIEVEDSSKVELTLGTTIIAPHRAMSDQDFYSEIQNPIKIQRLGHKYDSMAFVDVK